MYDLMRLKCSANTWRFNWDHEFAYQIIKELIDKENDAEREGSKMTGAIDDRQLLSL